MHAAIDRVELEWHLIPCQGYSIFTSKKNQNLGSGKSTTSHAQYSVFHISLLWPSHFRADSGFRHVTPTEYKPRLFHFHGVRKKIEVKQVPLSRKSLDSSDVFILDLGLTLYQVFTFMIFIICYCTGFRTGGGKVEISPPPKGWGYLFEGIWAGIWRYLR